MPIVDDARNPWRQLYLPLALRKPPRACGTALRYALLSVSAYNRARSFPQLRPDDTLRASGFKDKAKAAIANAISQISNESDTPDKWALFAAAMTMITIDIFSGHQTGCSAHMELASRVFVKTGGQSFWKSNPQSDILFQIFRCYGMLDKTVQVASQPPEAAGRGHPSPIVSPAEEADSMPMPTYYILGISFGVSLETPNLLNKVVSVASVLQEDNSIAWPADLIDSVRSLEDQLHRAEETQSWTGPTFHPPWTLTETGLDKGSATSDTTLPPAISEELMSNHQQAFHNAVILFFYRVVHRASRSKAGQLPGLKYMQNSQAYVDRVLECLENIDCLTHGADIKSAIDTSLRHRVIIWLSRAAKKGVGNVERGKQLVMEVWRRTDRCLEDDCSRANLGLGPVDWRSVVKDSGVSIMLCWPGAPWNCSLPTIHVLEISYCSIP
ncbi:hypothetical protein BO71DRAFT_391053 [Aspergillus ellipticus CBS 707.79]|uniref:Uncharacterized protein n=1 Tax=Aspergillus ellipticus CBS 707.79 TaxID=1448320 RepID=A0A319CU84_9EURO|nr:hypothetical protein BO71DRAFT_391053 [Aspergillus ellipticus CBS 707.79]